MIINFSKRFLFKPFIYFYPLKCFSLSQDHLAETFKKQYNPSKKGSTQYNLPDSMKKAVASELVRKWTKLVSFPLDETSIVLKEYRNKRGNDPSLSAKDKEANTPRESYYEATLLFSKNHELRHNLRSFKSEAIIRIDLLFDLLDCLAGLSSFSHSYALDNNLNLKDAILVTLAVDHVHFYKPWLIKKDLRIVAYPSWCSQSVIEIRIDLFQNQNGVGDELVGSSVFLMAARHLKNPKEKYAIPKLDFDGEEEIESCKIRFEEGERNQEKRRAISQHAEDLPAPGEKDIQDMHEIFKLCEKKLPGKDFIYQEETKMMKTMMMYPQNQNLFGTIFGGFTIKEGFEIGLLAAYMYCAGEPFKIIKIDDFNFFSPVYVGSALHFESSVIFAKKGIVQVMVVVWVITPKREKKKTSVVYLTFETNKIDTLPVYPKTYAEALNYFEGKKKLMKLTEEI